MRKISKLFAASAFMFVPVMVNATSVNDAATLKACLEEQDGGICAVEADINTTDSLTAKGTKTLDLGEYIVTVNSTIHLDEGADLTIQGTGKLTTTTTPKQVIRLGKSGRLNITSGTIESGNGVGGAIGIEGSGDVNDGNFTTVTIGKDATLRGNYGIAIFGVEGVDHVRRANGVQVQVYGTIDAIADPVSGNGAIGITVNGNNRETEGNVPNITIYEGAKITAQRGNSSNANSADAPAIYAAGYANWYINGGEIEGDEVFSMKSGYLSVSGGKFTSKGEMSDPLNPYNNGSEATGAVVSITSNDAYAKNIGVSLNGGTYISEKSNVLFEGRTASEGTAVDWMSISGGKYEAKTEGMDAIKVNSLAEVGPFINDGVEIIGGDVSKYQYVDTSKLEEILNKLDRDNDFENIEINPDDYEDYFEYMLAVLKTKYTEESAKQLIAVIREMGEMGNISRAEQEKFDAFVLKFEEAYNGLVLVNPKDTGTSPKTGDPIVTTVSIGLVSLLGIGALLKFRKKNSNN